MFLTVHSDYENTTNLQLTILSPAMKFFNQASNWDAGQKVQQGKQLHWVSQMYRNFHERWKIRYNLCFKATLKYFAPSKIETWHVIPEMTHKHCYQAYEKNKIEFLKKLKTEEHN